MNNRIDLGEVDYARIALVNATRQRGRQLSVKEGIGVILDAGKTIRNQRLSIAGALTLADMAEDVRPEAGDAAWILVEELDAKVCEMLVMRYAGHRIMLAPGFPTKQRWWDLEEVYGSHSHAHLAAALRMEDARIASMEAVVGLEELRDAHLAAANDVTPLYESETSEAARS